VLQVVQPLKQTKAPRRVKRAMSENPAAETKADTITEEEDLNASHVVVSSHDEINHLLNSVQCGDFINNAHGSKAVSIPVTADVFAAAQILAGAAVTSAPVIDEETGRLCGMFDYDDLAALVLAAFQKDSLSKVNLTDEHMDLAKFLIESHISHLGNAPAQNVADLSKNKPAVLVRNTAPLATAVKHFKKGKRRCVVVDADDKFVGMLSQSDVVKFLHGAAKKKEADAVAFSAILDTSLEDLNIARKEVACINENKSVLDALQEMYRLNISGVAITDSGGNITGSISLKDLKYAFQMQWFQVLENSCRSYIASARRTTALKERGGMDVSPVISVNPNTKLWLVIESLVATKTHRVWIVENRKPVGVVALADIIRAICN
jgi:CBS domain-containing protein